MKGGDHRFFGYRGDHAFFHRRCGPDTQWMAIEAPLAEKLTRFQNPDDRFLALLGHDSELDTTFLNVKNRIRRVSLLEDALTSLKFQDCFASPYLGEKGRRIEPVIGWIPHRSLLCSDERAPTIIAVAAPAVTHVLR